MSDRTEWTSQRHWTQNTERRQTKQRHATICVRPHYKPPSTQNVNMTRTLLQTTGSKDVPNIIFMWKP